MNTAVVTAKDVASKAGVSIETVYKCLNDKYASKYSKSTVSNVRKIASNLGYEQNVDRKRRVPANPVFASRAAETEAMEQLRKTGHSDAEVAHRCGVTIQTVIRRIGKQPAVITAANKKLAGQVRSAKAKIKANYQQQQLVTNYNLVAAKLNAQLLEAQKMKASLESMQKQADAASKATKMPLLNLMSFTSNVVQ